MMEGVSVGGGCFSRESVSNVGGSHEKLTIFLFEC